jgi:hypothetical protein
MSSPPGTLHNTTKSHQQVTLLFPEALPLGTDAAPVLLLNFTYFLVEGLDGFYLSQYIGVCVLCVY